MATTPIELVYKPGKTLTVDIHPEGSDTADVTARSLTEATNREGVYTGSITESLSGYKTVHVYEGSILRMILDLRISDTTSTYYCMPKGSNVLYAYAAAIALDQAFSTGVKLKDNTIRAGAFDESTAYPLTSADSGATAVSRFDSTTDTVTVGTNNDKTGYSISGTLTTLDALDTAQDTQHSTTQSAISSLNNFDPATDTVANVTTVGTCTTNTDMRGTDSALLASSAPANFGDLAIAATTGKVTVGTNDDKTGYSISGTLTTLDALDTSQDSQHSTTQTAISALNDFNPASDTVAHVTLVDTTTTNTDMRGTDSAFLASSAPTNFSDLAITATTGKVTVGTNDDKTGYAVSSSGLDLVTSWTVDLTGSLSGSVGGVTGGINTTSGTITTLDGLDTAQDTQHSTTQSAISGLNDLSAADVNAEVDTALSEYDGPTQSEMTAAFTEIKGATWSSTTDTLEAIRDRGDAAWTTGAGGTAPTVEEIRAEMDANSTQLAAIVADTNELQTNQSNWTTADVSGLATAAALATVDSNVDSILTDTGTTIPAQISGLNDISAADVIDYDMGNGRTVAEALAPLRNKWTIASGVYTVYDTDDTTVLWTAASVQTAGDPTSSIDPV